MTQAQRYAGNAVRDGDRQPYPAERSFDQQGGLAILPGQGHSFRVGLNQLFYGSRYLLLSGPPRA